MTDGIIQQVIKLKLSQFSFKENGQLYNNSYYDKATKVLIAEIEQELIEKIKGSRNNIELQHGIISIKELIGDNQE